MAVIRQIQSLEQINYHLLSVYRSQPVMHLGANGGTIVDVGRFIYDFEQSKQIVIRTDSIQLQKSFPVYLSYFIDGFEHRFESEVIAAKTVKNAGVFIKIRRPPRILGINRRRWMRVWPSRENPVTVTLDLPNSGSITIPVQEFSSNGFSIVAPFDCPLATCREDVPIILKLPDCGSLSVTVSVKNRAEQKGGVRIGAEIKQISENDKRRLIDYTVADIIENTCKKRKNPQNSQPTICCIHDNGKLQDTLAHLEQPYRLICHDLQSDWKNMRNIDPDAFLFNFESIDPAPLMAKLKALKKFEETPAIVIADENQMDIACDAVIVSSFNDPGVLIETIEQTLSNSKKDMDAESGVHASEKLRQRFRESIFVVDLIGDFSPSLLEAIESQSFSITMNSGLSKMLDTILKTKPVAIVIYSKNDVALTNLLRMLKMNKHTKALPLILLSTDVMADRSNLQGNLNANVNLLPAHAEPITLARHIAAIANYRE